jgi:hypothetical protein
MQLVDITRVEAIPALARFFHTKNNVLEKGTTMKVSANHQKWVLSGQSQTLISKQNHSRLTTIVELVPVLLASVFAVLTILVFTLLLIERREFNAYKAQVQSIQVEMDLPRPTPGQEATDLAMAVFSIDGGVHVNWPIFDASLSDRGLTSGGTFDFTRSILVGTPAFTSWGVLGSTLGHEIEIHGSQSFIAIIALDGLSQIQENALTLLASNQEKTKTRTSTDHISWGTAQAERKAYLYEASSAKRYGLQPTEVDSILAVMDAYYPDNSARK